MSKILPSPPSRAGAWGGLAASLGNAGCCVSAPCRSGWDGPGDSMVGEVSPCSLWMRPMGSFDPVASLSGETGEHSQR